MKKGKKGRKLSRKRDQRKALLKGLALSLIERERIRTTEARAKEVSPFVEKCISKAKKEHLTAIRYLSRFFPPKIVKKMTSELGKRYKNKKGGYTRIVKTGQRKSDGAKMAIIELVK